MPKLKAHVFGKFESRCYGLAGDRVTIIADHDNVLIVENTVGSRFSVRREDIEFDEAVKVEEQPVVVEEKQTTRKKSASKKSNPDNTSQQSLF